MAPTRRDNLRDCDDGNANNFISVRTRGVTSNRDGIGAVGLAKDTQVSAIEIDWPSGQKDRITAVPANQHIVVEEGKGIVTSKARGPDSVPSLTNGTRP